MPYDEDESLTTISVVPDWALRALSELDASGHQKVTNRAIALSEGRSDKFEPAALVAAVREYRQGKL